MVGDVASAWCGEAGGVVSPCQAGDEGADIADIGRVRRQKM